jgi:hypothetical protein
MAHGNDPSLPHEVAACTTLEVVYEGCTAALACQPISSSVARCRAARLCPGEAGVEQGEPVLGGDRGLEQRDKVAHGDERAIQSAAPGARAASSSCAIAAKRASWSCLRIGNDSELGDRRRAAAGGCRKREGSDRVASELSAQDAGVSSLRNRDAACAGHDGRRYDVRQSQPGSCSM